MPNAAALIQQYAQRFNVDPVAALIVALGEGGLVNRSGDVGDLGGGGSYGPFQLYAQGALPKRLRGRPAAADRWAWSPAGIRYALRQIAGVSRGMHGERAIENIIRRFERPEDPDASVEAALGRLRSGAHKPYLGSGRANALAKMPVQANAYGLRGLMGGPSPGSVLAGVLPALPESPAGLLEQAPPSLAPPTDELVAQLAAIRRKLIPA